MNNLMNGIIEMFSFSEYPAGDWHHGLGTAGLFALIALVAFTIAYVITYIDQTGQRIYWNLTFAETERARFKAVLDSILGKEYRQLLKEQVTNVVKLDNGYFKVSASDTESCKNYLVIPVESDIRSEEYCEAVKLSGGNEALFEELKPEGRVISRLSFYSEDYDYSNIVIDGDYRIFDECWNHAELY